MFRHRHPFRCGRMAKGYFAIRKNSREPIGTRPTHRSGTDDALYARCESIDRRSRFHPPGLTFTGDGRQISRPTVVTNGGTPPACRPTIQMANVQLIPVGMADGHLDWLNQLLLAGEMFLRRGQATGDLFRFAASGGRR